MEKTSNGYIAFLDLNSNKNVHFKNEYTAIIYSSTIQIRGPCFRYSSSVSQSLAWLIIVPTIG